MSPAGRMPIRPPSERARWAAVIPLLLLMSGSASGGCVDGGTFQNVGNDTAARFFHRASLLPNGLVMVSGGMRLQLSPLSLVSLSAISFFNPLTNSFSASFAPLGGGPAVSPVLATPRSTHTQTTLADGRVLITGGYVSAAGTSPGVATTSVEVFDPQTGLVSAGPAMAIPRAAHTASLLADGRVVVAGGGTWQVFDAGTGAWSPDHSLQRSRLGQAAVVLPDHDGPGVDAVLLIGGTGSGPDTLEVLHPGTGLSTLVAATLSIGVDDLAAARLPNGRVLIVGGQDATTGNTIDRTYLFDPADSSLSPAPAPPGRSAGIADHQIAVIGSFAMIFGGEQEIAGTDTELNYAAVFDGVAGAWQPALTMNFTHDDFPAVHLNDGRILLIGGGAPFLGQEIPTATCEVFVPASFQPGDMNKDGTTNLLDVPAFSAALLNSQAECLADVNADGRDDGRDIQPFTLAALGP